MTTELSAGATTTPVLQIAGLEKIREKADIRFELTVDRFEVRGGQFSAVFGDSGCGKSTLLDMLGLILEPTQCERFLYRDENHDETNDVAGLWNAGDQSGLARVRARALGYVLQTGGLLPFLTVEENVVLPLRHLGVPVDRERVNALMERIGIIGQAKSKPGQLSGGQRQRVAIARALVHEPSLILADEPTAAVDKRRAMQIVEEFREAAVSQGAAVIMVTHDQGLIEDLADLIFGFELSTDGGTTKSRCTVTTRTS